MKRSRDELIKIVSDYVGDRNDDASISLLEDISDSVVEDTEDWKGKYEALDKEWRERYRSRFENGNQLEQNEAEKTPEEARDIPDDPEEVDPEALYEGVFDDQRGDD